MSLKARKMSQFITSAGKELPPKSYGAIRLIPAEQAQAYVSRLVPALKEQDGENVYFIDDGSSGTSDEIFTEVDEAIAERGSIEGTLLADVLMDLHAAGHTVRIWCARSGLDDYKDVVECDDIVELKEVLSWQGPTYHARLAASKSFSA